MSDLEAIKQSIEERGDAIQRYHDLASQMVYEGNSIQWGYFKSKNYGSALLEAWDALREAGIKCDGRTTVAEGIRLLAQSKR